MTGPPLTFEIHEGRSGGCLRLSLTGAGPRICPNAGGPTGSAASHEVSGPARSLRLEFIDSTGIHLLIRTFGEARMKRWPVEIEPDLAPEVMRVFRLAHLDNMDSPSVRPVV